MAQVSRTASFVAMYRALESYEPRREPLFRDPYAIRFLPPRYRALIRFVRLRRPMEWLARYADWRAPGARTSAIARTAFIDDVVRREVAGGAVQLVVLGAGYDCRAQRMPELAGVKVFEVDRAPTQEHKRSLLGPTRSIYVPVDFLKDDTFEELAEHGWERSKPTLFIWEGVTNYLDEAAVVRVLSEVAKCAPGSTIVFTYVHRGVIDGTVAFPGAERIVNNVKGMREPWTFGIAPGDVKSFTAKVGLNLKEDLGADEYRARYLPAWENMKGYAFYRVAVAGVAG